MTHQGSSEPQSNDLLMPGIQNTGTIDGKDAVMEDQAEHYCDFCRVNSSKFLRFVFLNKSISVQRIITTEHIRGP